MKMPRYNKQTALWDIVELMARFEISIEEIQRELTQK